MTLKRKVAGKFPFNTCNNKWLFDSTSLTKYGLNLTIQYSSIKLQDFETIGSPRRSRRLHLVDESDSDSDNESIMDYEHEPPSPILVPVEAPKSSIRRSSFTKDDKDSASLQICYSKIESIIDEHFPMANDYNYITIKNFVCNCMLQQELDIKEFLGRIVNHRYRNELSDIIRTIFIEKFEEIKLEGLIDYFNNFLNLSGVVDLNNPHFYEQYYRIWKFRAEDYLSYHEEYFFAYFNNGGKAPVSAEHILLQNGFLINYARFRSYFAYDVLSYEDDWEEFSDPVKSNHISSSRQSFSSIPSMVLESKPKRLRFNEEVDLISINRHLPVDHVFRSDHLARHNLNHEPKEVYVCDFQIESNGEMQHCGKRFVRKDLKERHVKRHYELQELEASSKSSHGIHIRHTPSANELTPNGSTHSFRQPNVASSSTSMASPSYPLTTNLTTHIPPNQFDLESLRNNGTTLPQNDILTWLFDIPQFDNNLQRDNLNRGSNLQQMYQPHRAHNNSHPAQPFTPPPPLGTLEDQLATAYDFNVFPNENNPLDDLLSRQVMLKDNQRRKLSQVSDSLQTYSSITSNSSPTTTETLVGQEPQVENVGQTADFDLVEIANLLGLNLDQVLEICNTQRMSMYLKNFWATFHPQFNFVHFPSFEPRSHPLLLVAMIATGASYFNSGENTEVLITQLLADELRYAIFKHEDFLFSKPWVIQALNLLEWVEKNFLSRKFHQRGHVHHGATVQLLQRSPMMGGNPSATKRASSTGSTSAEESDSNVEDEVNTDMDLYMQWVESESMRRVTFMTFYLDITDYVKFRHSPHIEFSQLQLLNLPCDERLWESTAVHGSFKKLAKLQKKLQTNQKTFLTGLRELLRGQYQGLKSYPLFTQKILLAGLVSLMFSQTEMNNSLLRDNSNKSWKENVMHTFDSCLDIVLNLNHGELYRPFDVFQLARIMACDVNHYDLAIFAGAPANQSVTASKKDKRIVERKMKNVWSHKRALECVVQSYKFLWDVLLGEQNWDSNKSSDTSFTLSHAMLMLWSYCFVVCGKESSVYRTLPKDVTYIQMVSLSAEDGPSSPEQLAPYDLRLAVGRSNGDIEIWNPRHSWTHELTLAGSKGRSIEGLIWSSISGTEPSRLFSIGGSTYVTEWDLKTGRPLVNYDCNAGTIWSIDVNPQGDKLAVGCDDGSVVVVDISGGTGSLEYDIICQRQDARVLSLKWNGDEQIVGGCADGRIRVWSYEKNTKGRILGTMRVDKSKTESTLVWTLEVLPKRNQLISGDSTGHVKVWDLKFFSLMQSFKLHDADVLCLVGDSREERFYSAGIDRKIHQYDLLHSKSSTKWVHSFNRLLHSNDIRSMAITENKSFNVLVSGGVERAITIQPIDNFQDSKYKKLLVNQQISNVLVIPEQQLVILWQDQVVKIWKILKNGKHKLIAKLSLSDDENITSVDFKSNLLAVSKMTSVKVYELDEVDAENDKYMINKIRDENFDSMISGAKKVTFITESKLLILTPDEELYQFSIDAENSQISLEDQIEMIEQDSSSNIPYNDNVKSLILTPNHKNILISRFNGSIEVYPLNGDDAFTLAKLSNSSSQPHLITCRNNKELLVLTNENKILEFNLFNRDQLLTAWSKRNSEFLPRQFLNLDDKPEGMFAKGDRLWVYGTTWICYFDLTKNIPISKLYKNLSTGKKRRRDGLSIDDDVDTNGDVVQLESSLKQSEIDKLKSRIREQEDGVDGDAPEDGDDEVMHERDSKVFSLTEKYRPIMKVADFGSNELLIVERPYFALPTTPAFNLPKLRV
ncbi:hypothetical protein KGF57_004675 [Candida theae]|uniref:Xylanolytic transcriptional activator regulatory domain-containing protein n=1 Tax=Candida theae TaxID=1198502 RepID=A0AAD5FWJ1_9ASCO|nr:uncharacterized protein KGF57_004675 [Candida theae]KAI5949465.1 hypothetical protein KGF57_004675 [Candida theae]